MFVTGNIGFGFYCASFTNIHATLLIHSCFLLNPGLVILFFGPYVVIALRRGVNRAMQIRRSVPFFSPISVDPPECFVKSEATTSSENKSVKVTVQR